MKKNTKIIRLTENDLERMVRRIIKESDDDYETSTPIKPITIHGKTYKFVEDLPTRELGIGGYTVQDGIVMVDGETPLQDWLTQDMDAEDYMEDMPKPGIGQKLKQSLRDLSGIGNKNDNTTLKQIHALIAKGMIDNVRRQPNGITAWVNNEALILDIEMPEIIYAGRNLEVTNLESKVLDLYSELLDFI